MLGTPRRGPYSHPSQRSAMWATRPEQARRAKTEVPDRARYRDHWDGMVKIWHRYRDHGDGMVRIWHHTFILMTPHSASRTPCCARGGADEPQAKSGAHDAYHARDIQRSSHVCVVQGRALALRVGSGVWYRPGLGRRRSHTSPHTRTTRARTPSTAVTLRDATRPPI